MKVNVQRAGGGSRFVMDLEPGSTKGATIGINVYNQNGSLFVPYLGPTSEPPVVGIASWGTLLDIPPNVTALADTSTTGIYVITGAGTSTTRAIVGTANQITAVNGSGVAGAPTIGLADLADTGVGISPLKIFTRDGKGRLEGTEDATTDDLPEGVTNLYFTTERDYLAAKAMLISGTNIVLTYDDVLFTITIDASGVGGAVASVNDGTGIDVDNTDPVNPIVNLDAGSIASLALADSSVQSVVAGTNVTVDNTDPHNPIVSASGGALSVSIECTENLAAGDFIRIYDSSGPVCRRADNTTALADGRADGFVLAGFLSGAMADVVLEGLNDQLATLVPGTLYVLSTTGDAIDLASLPAVSGTILQPLGVAINATTLSVNIDEPILRG